MKRKDFIKQSASPGFSFTIPNGYKPVGEKCFPTPGETDGPFPTHQPTDLIAENIVAGKSGMPPPEKHPGMDSFAPRNNKNMPPLPGPMVTGSMQAAGHTNEQF